jgi:hypothetical protein
MSGLYKVGVEEHGEAKMRNRGWWDEKTGAETLSEGVWDRGWEWDGGS